MDMESIRELFSTASIVIGRNGIEVVYPARDCSMYRNYFVISRPCDVPVFANLIRASKKFSIIIRADAFKFVFSNDGNEVDEMCRLPAISDGITHEQLRKEYMESRAQNDGSHFMSFFDGADLSDERDLMTRLAAFLDDMEQKEETNVSDLDDFRRWKEIRRLSRAVKPRFGCCQYDEYEGSTEFIVLDEKNGKEIVFEGKEKDIIEGLFRLSCTEVDYSCVFGNSFFSLLFGIN